MDLGDLAGVLLSQHAAAVDQDPDRSIWASLTTGRARGADADDRDGVGVGVVGLRPFRAALTSLEPLPAQAVPGAAQTD